MASVKFPSLVAAPGSTARGRSSFSSGGGGAVDSAAGSRPISPTQPEETAVALAAVGDPQSGVAPPSLSHLVSASLASAAAHERAIQKWTREITREMDEYKAQVAAQSAQAKDRRRREQMGLKAQDGPDRSPNRGPLRSHAPPRIVPRETNYWGGGGGAGFLRDDIQSVHPKGKARFYPTNLVKVPTTTVHTHGSLSARDTSPPRGRRAAPTRGSVTARNFLNRKGSVMAHSGSLVIDAPSEATGVAQFYAAYSAPLAPSTSAAPLSPKAAAALLSLPPTLNAAELKPAVSGGSTELDEAAAFKSPALYMDMKMRQLFHPEVNAAPQSASQKAHVIAHLLDTLGELVEPDSAQAFTALIDTIKELVLSSEYKNLISVVGAPGRDGHSKALAGTSQAGGGTSLVSLHKELSRREKAKWAPNGQAVGQTRPAEEGAVSLIGGRFLTKAEKARERERLERERLEKEYFARQGGTQVATSAAQFIQDYESRRKGVPSIAFEGDANEAARAPTIAANGVQPYRSGALNLPASMFANLRQIPAAFLEVAWSLKEDVAQLCARMEHVATATKSQTGELARVDQEQSFLTSWHAKKSLQLQLYQRSEINLSNEIILLKNLLVDLKEEFELLTEETVVLEEDYLRHGIVFGGSFAMETFRFEEENRDYPKELLRKRREMESTLARIDSFKKDLLDIHTERDLLLTRIEVLEQAVNMMHNASDEEEEDDDEDSDSDDEEARAIKEKKAAQKERDALEAARRALDPNGYPFKQQRADDLRGRGTANTSVPSFLRFNGWFPNRNFSKQDVEVRVKEIWSLKTIADEKALQVGGHQTGLREYFELYLQKRFQKHGSAQKSAESPAAGALSASGAADSVSPSEYALEEFVLNFFTTLERHMVDQDFILFLKVICGELNEDHYRDQMKLLANFKAAIFQWDMSEHDASKGERIDGLIGKATFLRGLRQFFPHKSERHMEELAAILERDCMTNGQVDGRKILADGDVEVDDYEQTPDVTDVDPSAVLDDSSGGIYTSNFLECIRHQYLTEIQHFTQKIRSDLYALYEVRRLEKAKALIGADEHLNSYSAMRHLERDTQPAMLTAYDIRFVLRAADMNRSTEQLTEFLKRGCAEPYLSKDTEVQIEAFMRNLVESGLVVQTNHWRRIPVKTPSLDAPSVAAALAEEERKEAADLLLMASPMMAINRRASMEDESQYFAARAGVNLNLQAHAARD